MMTINKLPILFALLTILIAGAGFFLKAPGEVVNNELLSIALYFAVAYWLLTIIMAASTHRLKPHQKKVWIILLISLPFFGGLLFQLLRPHIKRNAHRHHHSANDHFLHE